jgi:hypothetical protein
MRLSYANVTATVALVFCAAGTAIASTNGGGTISQVCADSSGNLSLPTSSGTCRRHGQLRKLSGARGAPGLQGPAGASGSAGSTTQLTSPDGRFTVAVSNNGITLSGPQTSLKLTATDLAMSAGLSASLTSGTTTKLTSGTAMALTTGTNLSLVGGALAELDGGNSVDVQTNGTATFAGGSKVNLGGDNCTKAAARVGDAVPTNSIATGSSVVFAC